MAGKGFRLRWQPTSASGTISEVMDATNHWPQIVHGSARMTNVFVKASRPDTTFDFKMASPTGNITFWRKSVAGELNEATEYILRGEYTLTIENVKNGESVTVDDSFECEFMFEDRKDK